MSDEDLTERITIRCSAKQKEMWEKASRADRRKLAEWLRIVADDAAKVVCKKQS